MMNEAMIKALETKGFKRWQKGNMDRMYINPQQLGLEFGRYNTGNISWAKFKGENISNSHCRKLLATKTYIDVATSKVVSGEYLLEKTVKEIMEELEA